MTVELFDNLPDGSKVDKIELRSGNSQCSILTYGATIQYLNFGFSDVSIVVGADHIAPYLEELRYFGASIGPVSNRIAGGKFVLANKIYHLTKNEEGRHCLHSGSNGAHNRLWKILDKTRNAVRLWTRFADAEDGFPGERDVTASFVLEDGVLGITYWAITDQPTPISLTSHAYFNLSADETIIDHLLEVKAQHYLPVNAEKIPTGEVSVVFDTPYDFSELRQISARPYDHNFCLQKTSGELSLAARLVAPERNGGIELWTTEPGVQVYTYTHGKQAEKKDGFSHKIVPYCSIALEPQKWPDAINQRNFNSPVIVPGETYEHQIRFKAFTDRDD
ncbi:aldose 1-epimerase [Maritalea mobilis]|uniref:Aldose 1-epimerase n=1 Tax=Maritalea mobilis TaxID=483324 RepID=A0A4R6VL37_9HYPH|nr:aldose epimerase family protein [Maritalea mobilis]TDQ64389.1 aldose 1-epimerase [Maritalea mobilis]